MSEAFGKYLLRLRKQKSFTRKQLAAESGVSEMSIRRYESGERTPPVYAMKKLAEALGVPSEEMIKNYDELERQFEDEFQKVAPQLNYLRHLGYEWRILGSFDAMTGEPVEDSAEALGIRYNGEWVSFNAEQKEALFKDIDSSIEFYIWKLWKEQKDADI